ELVAEIEFAGWTNDGMVRQAAFKGLRENKPAQEVQAEAPPPADTALVEPVKARERSKRAGSSRAGSRRSAPKRSARKTRGETSAAEAGRSAEGRPHASPARKAKDEAPVVMGV